MTDYYKNINARNITSIALIMFLSFFIYTEFLTDNSVLTYSPNAMWSILIALILFFGFMQKSNSYFLASLLISGVLIYITVLIIFCKNTVGFYIVDEVQAKNLISNTGTKDYIDIIKISGEWIKDQSVTVIFQGEKNVSYPNSQNATIDKIIFELAKSNLKHKIKNEDYMRKDSKKALIITEEFELLNIKNQQDEKLLINMLNEIFYSKFAKNLVLLLKVDNYLNLKANGFCKLIIDKSYKERSLSIDDDTNDVTLKFYTVLNENKKPEISKSEKNNIKKIEITSSEKIVKENKESIKKFMSVNQTLRKNGDRVDNIKKTKNGIEESLKVTLKSVNNGQEKELATETNQNLAFNKGKIQPRKKISNKKRSKRRYKR